MLSRILKALLFLCVVIFSVQLLAAHAEAGE